MSPAGEQIRFPSPVGLVPRRRPAVLDASRTALIPLRPLTIGEILDGGFLVVRRNARLMLGLPLVVAGGTAVYILIGVGLWFLLGNTTVQGVQVALVVVMALVLFLLLVQCLVWMTAILSRLTLQTVLGEGFAPATGQLTLKSSLPLFWPVLGLSLLQYLASSVIQTAVSLLYYGLVIGSVLTAGDTELGAGAVVVVSVLTFLLTACLYGYIALTVPALATESRHAPGWIGKPLKATTVISSFERSFRLVGLRNLVRVTLVLAAAMLISLALLALLAAGALAMVLLFATSINHDVATVLASPWTLFGVFAFAVVVAMSGLLAYVAAVQTLLYLDLRMRREGLDLAMRFDCVPVPQPSAPPLWIPPPPPPGVHR
ncbi:MAG: hypothetical protein ABWX96_07870 [Propionibacteriaceae bacterium]